MFLLKSYAPILGAAYLIFNTLYWGEWLDLTSLSVLETTLHLVVQFLICFMLIYTHMLNRNFCQREVIQALKRIKLYELFSYSYFNWALLLGALILNVSLYQLSLVWEIFSVNFQIGFLVISYFIVVFFYVQYENYYEQIPQLDENATKNFIAKFNIFLV